METISVNGESYVRASSLARELGYTADYVGQLCRSGAVKAEMVGRSWYVHEPSLREHKKSRYRSTATKSKTELEKAVTDVKDQPTPLSGSPNYLNHSLARYESDESALWPEPGVVATPRGAARAQEPVEAINKPIQTSTDEPDTHSVPLKRPRERILPKPAPTPSADPLGSVEVKFVPKAKPSLGNKLALRPSLLPSLRPVTALALVALAALVITAGLLGTEHELIVSESQLSTAYAYDLFSIFSF